jgi:hypothetical protein
MKYLMLPISAENNGTISAQAPLVGMEMKNVALCIIKTSNISQNLIKY